MEEGHPAPSPDLSPEEIWQGLKSRFWKEIICYKSVGSTNTAGLALPLADDEEESGRVIAADSQEKGRGRFDRRWISPPGVNIHLSIVLRPEIPPGNAPLLTMLGALASAAAIKKETGIAVSVKWPNDLVVSGKKLGGILAEARTVNGLISRAVIGIGINLNARFEDFPPEISEKATSALILTGSTFSRSAVIASIMNEFETRYKKLKYIGGFPLVREMRPLLSSLGREVVISDGGPEISGFVEDITDDGRLIICLPSGARKKIGSGEIIGPDDV